MNKARYCLESAKKRSLSVEQKREMAIELAGLLLHEARRIQTYHEGNQQAQLARLMKDGKGKDFTTSMTDQCFRSHQSYRVADQLVYLIKKFGIPNFLSWPKRAQLLLFKWFGKPLAPLMVPLFRSMVRRETSSVILPGEAVQLSKHMKKRRAEGVRVNLNHIGEAILGEEEAFRRLQTYLRDLANPEIECVSIKISTIFSQISLLGREATLEILGERLKQLYRAAQENHFVRADGKSAPKFVYLDMEEYRDLHLTVEVFKTVLEDSEFYRHSAGIVLQSYLPDAFLLQQELTAWAMKRHSSGGAPIKIRIVKGANLAMEQVEASMKGWEQAPYIDKSDADANYKRMVMYGCQLDRAQAVRLGIASHNLFDIAYAMILRAEKGIEKYVGFEMLEGMAEPLRKAVQALIGDMLLYCPAATKTQLQSAIAYLMRRLDENTAPDNFLRHAFEMLPGTAEWQSQAGLFSLACHEVDLVGYAPRRCQSRFENPSRQNYNSPFSNEPDTDWALPQNVKWAENILRGWSKKEFETIPLVIGGRRVPEGFDYAPGIDPSFPGKEAYRYALGSESDLETALQTANETFKEWSKRPLRERLLLIEEVAYQLRARRADLLGAMVADTGKTIAEADVEVSEAIDFATYYRRSAEALHYMEDIRWTAKGVVLVAPPWNFPCSIPAGGILAALAAGNTVIFKPAPEAVLVGWQLVNIFWEAGIDPKVLQFFCCLDDPIGTRLVQDERIAAVVLTGATSTARRFLKLRPGIDLIAETGGKNSMIITSMADRDLAIKDLIQSAFGHAGQKCSACSLAILEKEVYYDPQFRNQLRDAVSSLKVGSPWDLSTKVNPLIREPSPELLRGLTQLDYGEEWLLEPQQDENNPQLWSPGIKLGVQPGSFTHHTELFGPLLGVMCAENLQEAIRYANGTSYGLTSGIHTLDEREQKLWTEQIIAGNCYINRTITGAIVRRQPFGGCKESNFGPGAKAGGPNYIIQLMYPEQKGLPREREPLDASLTHLSQYVQGLGYSREEMELWAASTGSYAFYWNHYFSKTHDPSSVLGQDNILSYVPHQHQVFRIQTEDSLMDVFRVIAAALSCRLPLEISCSFDKSAQFKDPWLKKTPLISFVEETEEQFAKRIAAGVIKRVRMLSQPSPALIQDAADSGCYIAYAPVLANGRLELLHYLREVVVSNDFHRYGYLGTRESERRAQHK